MEENTKKKNVLSLWLLDFLRGIMIGVAFIIPGFSGGSVAVLLGIYEKLIGAISDIFKSFKKSFLTLLPIGLGMVVGAVALLFPLGWAIEKFPIPTVSLFVGLALGGIPSMTDKIKGKPRPVHFVSFLIPLIFALSLSFLPVASDVNLLALNPLGYVILVLVGAIGSVALVVPGISGSMLLLILGYYNPVVNLVTDHLLMGRDVPKSILVVGCLGVGIVCGFFAISNLMKWLISKYQKGTYIAIIGFIIGSVPAIYVSTVKEAGLTLTTLPSSVWYWIASFLLLVLGILISLFAVFYIGKKQTGKNENYNAE